MGCCVQPIAIDHMACQLFTRNGSDYQAIFTDEKCVFIFYASISLVSFFFVHLIDYKRNYNVLICARFSRQFRKAVIAVVPFFVCSISHLSVMISICTHAFTHTQSVAHSQGKRNGNRLTC